MINKPDYLAPQTLTEAFAILGKQTQGAYIIAGGTDLIPRMRANIVTPKLLVDLRLLNLNSIVNQGEAISIGARVTHAEMIESGLLAKFCPILIDAAREIAGPPIRNRGTIGGNLVNASPAADLVPPLIAYDALVILAREKGTRRVPLAEFIIGPGKTILTPDELLTEIVITLAPARSAAKYIKLGKRKAMAIAIVSAATRITLDESGKISQARIALGSVAPTPLRAIKAESVLIGKAPSEELFIQAGQKACVESCPISDLRASVEYRKKMVAVLTRKALAAAWQQIKEIN